MIHVPSSEVRHFYKLIRDGDLSESEFGEVWNDSIKRAIEAAIPSVQRTGGVRRVCGKAADTYVRNGHKYQPR